MTQEKEKVEVRLKFYEEEFNVVCEGGEYFYKSIPVDSKYVFPCERCPYFRKEDVERDWFGISGTVGGSIFKKMNESQFKRLGKKVFECRRFNRRQTIEF